MKSPNWFDWGALPTFQLDAPHYPLLLDPKTRTFYEGQELGP